MNFPYNLVAIDIETTSTDSEKGSIVQLAAIALNHDFEIIPNSDFSSYVKPLDSFRDQNAMNIHGISEGILQTAPYLSDVLELFENYCGESRMLAAWGNYFDLPFLQKQYQKIQRKFPFHRKSIDLKSIAIWEMSKKNIKMTGGIKTFLRELDHNFEGCQHDALDDIKNSVKILQILKGR